MNLRFLQTHYLPLSLLFWNEWNNQIIHYDYPIVSSWPPLVSFSEKGKEGF